MSVTEDYEGSNDIQRSHFYLEGKDCDGENVLRVGSSMIISYIGKISNYAEGIKTF